MGGNLEEMGSVRVGRNEPSERSAASEAYAKTCCLGTRGSGDSAWQRPGADGRFAEKPGSVGIQSSYENHECVKTMESLLSSQKCLPTL